MDKVDLLIIKHTKHDISGEWFGYKETIPNLELRKQKIGV